MKEIDMSTTTTTLIANTFAGMTPIVLQFDDTKNDRAAGENFQTAYGVTEYTWANAINEGIVPNKPLSQATRDECLAIVRADYYNRCRIGALPAGPNLQVYHTALLSGAGHSAALLNRIVGASGLTAVTADTIQRANSFRGGPAALIEALFVADETFLAALANAPKYIHGWDRAEDVMRDAAYHMLGMQAPTPMRLPQPMPPRAPAAVPIADPNDNIADQLNEQQLTHSA